MRISIYICGMAAVSALLIGSITAVATPPDDELSRTEAEQVATELIDTVSESYDCAISFDSMHDDFDLDSVQYSVVVRLDGKECSAALQELRSQGRVFRLSFGKMRTVDLEADDVPPRNLDLIHEVNPQTED
jgi:hypothetical protein